MACASMRSTRRAYPGSLRAPLRISVELFHTREKGRELRERKRVRAVGESGGGIVVCFEEEAVNSCGNAARASGSMNSGWPRSNGLAPGSCTE